MNRHSDDAGIGGLLRVIQQLSLAESLTEIQQIARTAVRSLADCDGATFVLRDGDLCYYADEDAISPLWKGRRFPIETCISGWAMLNRSQVVIPDIYQDPRVPHDAYRPTFVRSLVMMPIRTLDPIGALGAYWADGHQATESEVELLTAVAEATSLALEKVSVREELKREVVLAKEAYLLSQTDELTGLLNRRGFAGEVVARFEDPDTSGAVAFIDVNGLKSVNDTLGHPEGDLLLQRLAATLRSVVRPQDVVGRLGGDEFAVFATTDEATLRDRLTTALGASASVGAEPLTSADGLVGALLAADADMYLAKRAAAPVRPSGVAR